MQANCWRGPKCLTRDWPSKRSAKRARVCKWTSILFLPSYSPDLNPIEKMWSKVKAVLLVKILGLS
jgi:transposase